MGLGSAAKERRTGAGVAVPYLACGGEFFVGRLVIGGSRRSGVQELLEQTGGVAEVHGARSVADHGSRPRRSPPRRG